MDAAGALPHPSQPKRPREPAPGAERREPSRPARAGHPVIAGYDGSQPSKNALAYAVGMSLRLDRPLLVVHVSPPGIYCEPLTGQVIGAARDREETERWLLGEIDEVCAGMEAHILTRQGNPARELAAAAHEASADALVIGAPGHLWHHIAGSVPSWLARHAQCPVIVVP